MARAFAIALVVALLGCGGDEAAKPDEPPVTVPLTLPPTSEQILTDDGSDEPEEPADEVEPTPTTEATTTTLAVGLPRGLGIPGADTISLGSGSSISNGFTVREVPFLEVVAFVHVELENLGWTVQPVPVGPDNRVVLQFAGPGAVGEATITPADDGTARVRLVLQAA